MTGLDKKIIDQIDYKITLKRVITDMRNDFIYSPHYFYLFQNHGQEIWEELSRLLKSGRFSPFLPQYINVPKSSGLIRHGSILEPLDRLLYQALIDYIAPIVEKNIDRNSVFSNVLLKNDPDGKMFEPVNETYQKFKESIKSCCDNPSNKFVIKTDIASYFDTIYQHNIINSLRSIGCISEITNLLEDLLLSFRERNSHGILQGMFPSDLLGNFYLHGFDFQLALERVKSIRYVDDIYIFADSKVECLKILSDICTRLRKDGLFLNESKTKIGTTNDIRYEETELDCLLSNVREKLSEIGWTTSYGFEDEFNDEEYYNEEEEEIENQVFSSEFNLSDVESLYLKHDQAKYQHDQIVKFCLPILAKGKSTIAVDDALRKIIEEPHLTRAYCIYLALISSEIQDLYKKISELAKNRNEIIYDWQYLWIYSSLFSLENIESYVVNFAIKDLKNKSISEAIRAISACLIGKHGITQQRNILKNEYSSEPSNYVKSAILHSSHYFPSSEGRACRRAWGGHSFINSLIARPR